MQRHWDDDEKKATSSMQA